MTALSKSTWYEWPCLLRSLSPFSLTAHQCYSTCLRCEWTAVRLVHLRARFLLIVNTREWSKYCVLKLFALLTHSLKHRFPSRGLSCCIVISSLSRNIHLSAFDNDKTLLYLKCHCNLSYSHVNGEYLILFNSLLLVNLLLFCLVCLCLLSSCFLCLLLFLCDLFFSPRSFTHLIVFCVWGERQSTHWSSGSCVEY